MLKFKKSKILKSNVEMFLDFTDNKIKRAISDVDGETSKPLIEGRFA